MKLYTASGGCIEEPDPDKMYQIILCNVCDDCLLELDWEGCENIYDYIDVLLGTRCGAELILDEE